MAKGAGIIDAAKCVTTTGPLVLGSWGVYAAEHAPHFLPKFGEIASWISIIAMVIAVTATAYKLLRALAVRGR